MGMYGCNSIALLHPAPSTVSHLTSTILSITEYNRMLRYMVVYVWDVLRHNYNSLHSLARLCYSVVIQMNERGIKNKSQLKNC